MVEETPSHLYNIREISYSTVRLVLYDYLDPAPRAIISRTKSVYTITDSLYSWEAPGRSLSESTGLRLHAASVEIDRPIFALASGLKQFAKCLVALLVASRTGELAKPWKSEGSAALALPSAIQHSSVQKLFCITNTSLAVPFLIRPRYVQYIKVRNWYKCPCGIGIG